LRTNGKEKNGTITQSQENTTLKQDNKELSKNGNLQVTKINEIPKREVKESVTPIVQKENDSPKKEINQGWKQTNMFLLKDAAKKEDSMKSTNMFILKDAEKREVTTVKSPTIPASKPTETIKKEESEIKSPLKSTNPFLLRDAEKRKEAQQQSPSHSKTDKKNCPNGHNYNTTFRKGFKDLVCIECKSDITNAYRCEEMSCNSWICSNCYNAGQIKVQRSQTLFC